MTKSEELERRREELVGAVAETVRATAAWASQYEHIVIEVRGDPAPRQSPRAFKNKYSGKVVMTTGPDTASKSWMGKIHLALEPFLPASLWDGPVGIVAKIQIYKKSSIPKKRIFPQVKPDLDNYLKNVLDALKGKVIVDDNQVVFIQAAKLYGDPPETKLMVFKVEKKW